MERVRLHSGRERLGMPRGARERRSRENRLRRAQGRRGRSCRVHRQLSEAIGDFYVDLEGRDGSRDPS
jgi:hypothetical protein